jgi:hypothetical protein
MAPQERVALLSTMSELAVDGAWGRIESALDQSQVDRLAEPVRTRCAARWAVRRSTVPERSLR